MSHFYLPDGTLIDGLRAARKCNALPSPTTVLNLIKGEGLIQYFRRQMFVAATTTPRAPGATDEEHYKACCRWAEEHGQTARDKGGDFHDVLKDFHSVYEHYMVSDSPGPFKKVPHEITSYADWFFKNVERVIHYEEFVLHRSVLGEYGGREDLRVLLKDGRIATLDVKTQDRGSRPRFNYYTNWALQLGAYAKASPPERLDCPLSEVIISFCIASNDPMVGEAYIWPRPASYYHGLFCGLLNIWKEENDYAL